jgi:hypothetical protein
MMDEDVAPPPCPRCGSSKSYEIWWGLYLPIEGEEIPDNVVLGGCCIDPGMLQRQCVRCGHRFDLAWPHQLDDESERGS